MSFNFSPNFSPRITINITGPGMAALILVLKMLLGAP